MRAVDDEAGNRALALVMLAGFGLFRAATPTAVIFTVLVVSGFFRSLQFTSLNAIAYADIESPRMGHASSLAGMMQQFSLALGVAIGGYALLAAGAMAGVPQTHALAFGGAFAIVALLSAPSLVFFGKLRPDAGAQVSGKAEPGHEVVEPKAEQRPAT